MTAPNAPVQAQELNESLPHMPARRGRARRLRPRGHRRSARDAAVLVGIGDQTPRTFSDPLFTAARDQALPLRLRRGTWPTRQAQRRDSSRVARPRRRPAGSSRSSRFGPPTWHECPRSPASSPRARSTRRRSGASASAGPQVKVISPWNEANHRSQPTFKNPQAGGAVLQHRPQVLPRLQDRRGRRDRRAEHGALAQGLPQDGQQAAACGASTTTATRTSARARSWAAPSAC